MTLSAERLEIANRRIQQTFARSSIAWQAIPHWDTGDPAQVQVRSDQVFAFANVAPAALAVGLPVPAAGGGPFGAAAILLVAFNVPFQVSYAQACAPTPDALLAAVIPRTVQLAGQVDAAVLPALAAPATAAAGAAGAPAAIPWYVVVPAPAGALGVGAVPPLLAPLIAGRGVLEDSGYRASSCIVASTVYFIDFNAWMGSNVITEGLLVAANANSLHRSAVFNGGAPPPPQHLMVMIGRRQEIAHGCAATASPGEEPVDLAVSVPPSLEVIGENAAGQIDLAVRVSLATRIKDERGVVVFHT